MCGVVHEFIALKIFFPPGAVFGPGLPPYQIKGCRGYKPPLNRRKVVKRQQGNRFAIKRRSPERNQAHIDELICRVFGFHK